MYVFDAWALLAWLQDEGDAAATVDRFLLESDTEELGMCQLNAGEVYYIVAKNRSRRQADEVRRVLEQMPIELVPVDEELVWAAAELKARYPISYTDAFAAALAMQTDAVLVTGDPDFEMLEERDQLTVRWLSRAR